MSDKSKKTPSLKKPKIRTVKKSEQEEVPQRPTEAPTFQISFDAVQQGEMVSLWYALNLVFCQKVGSRLPHPFNVTGRTIKGNEMIKIVQGNVYIILQDDEEQVHYYLVNTVGDKKGGTQLKIKKCQGNPEQFVLDDEEDDEENEIEV